MATKLTPEEWVTSSGDPSDLGFSIARSPQPFSPLPYGADSTHQWRKDYGGATMDNDACLGQPPPSNPNKPTPDDGGSGQPRGKPISSDFPCQDMDTGWSQSAADQIPDTYPFNPETKKAILAAAKEYGINPILLAGIGLQESHLGDGKGYIPYDPSTGKGGTGDNGHGRGLWQIDDHYGTKPPLSLTAAQLLKCQSDPAYCAMQAAKLIAYDLALKKNQGNVMRLVESYNGTPGTAVTIAYAQKVCHYMRSFR
ncbi:MAG: hypothetical protein Q8922_04300 [Bacteroidota bacterium]|nr:hypothetical protein [Bacteroidota bacterium]MDP4231801.1 hypothetical protein [Bacteroidota bacterium]MDP4242687.1 hypothetical protein [Bacteroidota bacterium]MDP4287138.1 hypothetical protein [Bacteroidota bacterium]